MKAKVV